MKTMTTNLLESIFAGDLMGMILPIVEIDAFEAKIDPNAKVLAFRAIDHDAAKDLERLIDFGPIPVLGSDVSPAPDEDGNYYIFVEISVSNIKDLAHKTVDLLNSIKYATANTRWTWSYRKKKNVIKLDDTRVTDRRLISKHN